jgi:predicted CXXCH cytochrome family protein
MHNEPERSLPPSRIHRGAPSVGSTAIQRVRSLSVPSLRKAGHRKSEFRCILGPRYITSLGCLVATSMFFAGLSFCGPACESCHPKETAQFLQSPMGKSVSTPSPLPMAGFKHKGSESIIGIEARNGRMIHRLIERGVTAEYAIAYEIGSGRFGRSYVVRIDNYLLQSPASWFASHGWDVSPGLDSAGLLDFDRTVDENCLFCHVGRTQFSDDDGRRVSAWPLTAISCDRCHGNGDEHVRKPSRTNIVNPAKLRNRARDSVCEQCHLKGAARVLNPGMTWRDFRPGDNLESTATVYLRDSTDVSVASQVEELSRSKCRNGSAGKLWCGSCHDPHGSESDQIRKVHQVCVSCHSDLGTSHPSVRSDCVGCHMPRRSAGEIGHVAITDHRIPRNAAVPGKTVKANFNVPYAWSEPQPEFRKRNLGVAYLLIGFEQQNSTIAAAGARILGTLSELQLTNDPPALAALGWARLQAGQMQQGLELCRRAAERRPFSAEYALKYGIALSKAGELASAEQELDRAISLDPSLQQAYLASALLFESQGKSREAVALLNRYLRWNPQNIMFKLQTIRLMRKNPEPVGRQP